MVFPIPRARVQVAVQCGPIVEGGRAWMAMEDLYRLKGTRQPPKVLHQAGKFRYGQ